MTKMFTSQPISFKPPEVRAPVVAVGIPAAPMPHNPQNVQLTPEQMKALASPLPNVPPPPVSTKVVPQEPSVIPVTSERLNEEFHTHEGADAEGVTLHVEREPAHFTPVVYISSNAPNLGFKFSKLDGGQKARFVQGRFVCETQKDHDKFVRALNEMSPGGRAMIQRVSREGAEAVARRHREMMTGASGASHRGPMTSTAMSSGTRELQALQVQQEAHHLGANPDSPEMRALLEELNGIVTS